VQTNFDPNKLLDSMLKHLKLKNDAALSRALDVAPPIISRIRHSRHQVGGSILLRMHEVTGMSITALRQLMGDRRCKFRISNANGRPKATGEIEVKSEEA